MICITGLTQHRPNVTNYLFMATVVGLSGTLVNLSSAFDTIDYSAVLGRVENWHRYFTGSKWISWYL